MATIVSRNLDRCHWRLKAAFPRAVALWAERYPDEPQPFLDCGVRSGAVQNVYFDQGRKPRAEVNKTRAALGLYLLGEEEAKRKVTTAKAGQSPHNYEPSFALDVAFIKNKKLVWTNSLFKRFADLLREIDSQITWGGDWDRDGQSADEKFIDRPHFEVWGWRTILNTAKPV